MWTKVDATGLKKVAGGVDVDFWKIMAQSLGLETLAHA